MSIISKEQIELLKVALQGPVSLEIDGVLSNKSYNLISIFKDERPYDFLEVVLTFDTTGDKSDSNNIPNVIDNLFIKIAGKKYILNDILLSENCSTLILSRYFDKIVNLTPHIIKDIQSNQELQPSGNVAKVEHFVYPLTKVNGFQIMINKFGNVSGIPEYDPNGTTLYLVSVVVFNALKYTRDDIICPGKALRDDNYTVIGCNGFNRFS